MTGIHSRAGTTGAAGASGVRTAARTTNGATPRDRALLGLAARLAESGPLADPNPRVGAVISHDGAVVGRGWHLGAGTAHAEAMALAEAGRLAAGATALVTLEPCAHHGRTPPCAAALVDAGIARVVYAVADPTATAGGGAEFLRRAGLDVVGPVGGTAAADLNQHWDFAMRARRPFVTVKLAGTLDGRVAAPDGSSRWITGPAARALVHAGRATAGAVVVGTGTALADDPSLTVRDDRDRPMPRQPLRIVVGHRDLPAAHRVRGAGFHQLRTHDPHRVLEFAVARQVHHLWLEGGPTLAAAFVRAGLVDELQLHLAPALLGDGPPLLGSLGIDTIADTLRFRRIGCAAVGEDVVLRLAPITTPPEDPKSQPTSQQGKESS